MKTAAIAVLAMGLLASCATTDASHVGPVLYEAKGDRFDLSITKDIIRLRERVGRGTFEYRGPVPTPITGEDALRLEGELLREYVVAGLAEEDTRRYAMEIVERPCLDSHGRSWPTTVTLDFFSDFKAVGCGGPTPQFSKDAAPG